MDYKIIPKIYNIYYKNLLTQTTRFGTLYDKRKEAEPNNKQKWRNAAWILKIHNLITLDYPLIYWWLQPQKPILKKNPSFLVLTLSQFGLFN